MAKYTKRSYARNYSESRIMYSFSKHKNYQIAKMLNSSTEGMHFEAGYAIEPGSEICIKMLNYSPDINYSPEAYKAFRATVKWCKEMENSDSSSYGIGVQYYKPMLQ